MIPVLGFATLSKFDMAQRLLDSIDYPVQNLIIVDNSGSRAFEPKVNEFVKNLWVLQMPTGLGANGLEPNHKVNPSFSLLGDTK
jgi:hypothetical protein